MSDNHMIDRSRDCNVIPNATDKPIELWMHHSNARSLIINLKTGDILSYIFSDGTTTAQSHFESSGKFQIEHNIFLEQEGDKVLFILKTNHGNTSSVDRYIKKMTDQNVKFAGEIISDVVNDFPSYDEYKWGEIYTGFIIELNNPSIFKTRFSDCIGKDVTQSKITTVGNEPSTLPNVEELVQLYFKYSNIGQLISWADERLALRLEEGEIDLSDLSDFSEHISNALDLSMKESIPFSHDHLYKEKFANDIINTLTLVKEKGLNVVSIAYLCGTAITQISRRLMYIDNDEPEFFPLISLAQVIVPFSIGLVIEQLDEDVKNNCQMQMQDELNRLQRIILNKVKDFDCDKLPDNMTKLLENFTVSH
jgi:hypothetical protein